MAAPGHRRASPGGLQQPRRPATPQLRRRRAAHRFEHRVLRRFVHGEPSHGGAVLIHRTLGPPVERLARRRRARRHRARPDAHQRAELRHVEHGAWRSVPAVPAHAASAALRASLVRALRQRLRESEGQRPMGAERPRRSRRPSARREGHLGAPFIRPPPQLLGFGCLAPARRRRAGRAATGERRGVPSRRPALAARSGGERQFVPRRPAALAGHPGAVRRGGLAGVAGGLGPGRLFQRAGARRQLAQRLAVRQRFSLERGRQHAGRPVPAARHRTATGLSRH